MVLRRASARLSTWAHLLLVLFVSSALATPYNHALHPPGTGTHFEVSQKLPPRQNAAKPFLLRIMPLGASITAGEGTNPPNGYRKPLRDKLRWRGWPVNMVGSRLDGDPVKFHNRQNEGHRGYVVSQMIGASNNSIFRKPNVVLINCGTNDASPSNKQNVPETATRMEAVLNHLYDKIENVTIILSTLMPRRDAAADANVNIINPGYRSLVQRFDSAGRKIVLAELNNGFLDTNTDYFDDIHPNEKGAAKLAAVWDQAILVAESRGFLTEPVDTGIPDDGSGAGGGSGGNTCDVTLGAGRGPVRTQVGFGADDGTYGHAEGAPYALDTGTQWFRPIENDTMSLAFAQLVNVNNVDPGGERDDLVHCTDADPGKVAGSCMMYLNVDGAFSGQAVMLDTDLKCLARGIRWGDVNGDGLDDFICINLPGNMYVALNRGGNPPTFQASANGGLVREGESWCAQDRVRLGDMDGDGRLDYCCIDTKGDIYCWRNGGVGDTPTEPDAGYWQHFVEGEPTFYAQHEPQGVGGVHLVDINGDHRSDWVYVYNNGSTKIFINQRGTYDEDGKGLRPHWVRAHAEHAAVDYVTTTKQVYFGRVEASGRADRIITKEYKRGMVTGGPITAMSLNEFPNKGAGGTKRKGDGVFYCDMFGRGRDDYLWVLSNGEITLFENIQSPPNWGHHGIIIDIQRERKSIHFGDWDGDGFCDILAVERHTGRVEMWRNLYRPGDKSPTFANPVWAVDSGSSQHLCTEGWGWGLYDQGLRFADLDGDKRVDYLCMEKNARTVGHLNKANAFTYLGQIKLAPKDRLDRANFKWADVTGDGSADLIWVDKFAAAARVWKNGGFIPAAGSAMTWIDQGKRFDGHGRGQNIHFPMLGNEGRGDYHDVYPGSGLANTWFNECPAATRAGEGEDDYPSPIDPGLPTPPDAGGGAGTSIWDFAPDFSNDPFPPYPPVKNPDGSNITIENLRGTRLYGWYGCPSDRVNVIQRAYRDFNTLSSQDGVYRNIDWSAQAATDFWGAAGSPPWKIPDDTRAEIQKIYAALSQVWSYPFPIFVGPGNYWRYLWIEIRCSDGTQGDGRPDPKNTCGDAVPNSGNCPNGQQPPPSSSNTLQAFSDNWKNTGTGYDRITFCTDFFKLNDLSVALDNGANSADKANLGKYDNTARVMLHEVTHLDYFVGTGPTGPNDPKSNLPYIWDLQITVTEGGRQVDTPVYGPWYCRIMRNWVDPDPAYLGYFTQRNADTYAWFAMAKNAPVNSADGLAPYDAPANLSVTSLDLYQIGGDEDPEPTDFGYPGCGDRT